jgi:protocatechuate 3,4-dioxygenase beta subunit
MAFGQGGLMSKRINRRQLLEWTAVGAGAALLAGCGTSGGSGPDGGLALPDADPLLPDAGPTPSCEETEDNIEGPFYRAGAPERDDLTEPDMDGTMLELRGTVRTTDGQTCSAGVAGAVLDFWQADYRGEDVPAVYDNAGFRLRGKVTTDANGSFRLITIIPGRYLNGAEFRPAHIHVKVTVPGKPVLTTQLYFAGDPFNDSDPFIHEQLIMTLEDGFGRKHARFDFVL